MRLGVMGHRVTVAGLLRRRLFVTRTELPALWQSHYWRTIPTRALPRCRQHRLRIAA